MLIGEKKKIDFLIDNDLKIFPYSQSVAKLFSMDELYEFENIAYKIKERLKTINENLSKKEKEIKRFTYEDMKKYYYTLMLEYYGAKLVGRLGKKYEVSVGYFRERIDDLRIKEEKAYEEAKINGPEYRKMIDEIINDIVNKKKKRK